MEKSKRTCVLLGIGGQERKIQNAQPGVVNVIKVWRQKDKCIGKSRKVMCHFSYWSVVNAMKVWRQKDMYGQKPEWTCVFLAIGEEEREIQNAQVIFIKVWRQKKSDL